MVSCLWAVSWTERERGWGPRDYGTQLFATEEAANEHVSRELSNRDVSNVPDWYLSPSRPFLVQATPEEIEKSKNGPFWK